MLFKSKTTHLFRQFRLQMEDFFSNAQTQPPHSRGMHIFPHPQSAPFFVVVAAGRRTKLSKHVNSFGLEKHNFTKLFNLPVLMNLFKDELCNVCYLGMKASPLNGGVWQRFVCIIHKTCNASPALGLHFVLHTFHYQCMIKSCLPLWYYNQNIVRFWTSLCSCDYKWYICVKTQ